MATPLPSDRDELRLRDKKPLFTDAEARAESERCLYCVDAPCIKACPTEIDIPTFIKQIASENVRGSAKTIFEQNILGHSCARVCPVEVLCVGSCVYTGWGREPIPIGRLQRYATETTVKKIAKGAPKLHSPKAKTGKKVALIGAGPASLACAAGLVLEGHSAVIFEKRSVAGGLNTTGIAPYKLHAEDAVAEVDWVAELGVEIRLNSEITKDSAAKLLAEFDAVYIGVGLGSDSKLGVPGEDGAGVVGATEWIERMKLVPGTAKTLGDVIVVGGGNTAIDVARECALLGAKSVTMVYRRGTEEMSGYQHELVGARKESVRFLTNTQPVGVVRDASGALKSLRVAKAEGGKPVAGTETNVACDLVALAIGQSKLQEIASFFPGVTLDKKGCVIADPKTGLTGNPKVFAGGDCINGGKEVVNAVADGRNTARHLSGLWEKR